MLVLAEVATFTSFSIAQLVYHSGGLPTGSLGSTTDLRAVVCAGLYVTLLTLIGYGLGMLLRSSASTISVFVSILFVIPIIVNFLPSSWQNDISKFLPSQLGTAMMSPQLASQSFSWLTSTLVLALYAVAIVAAGTIIINRRDA